MALFRVLVIPLLRLNLLESLQGKHIVKVTLLGHLVQAHDLINIANSETFVLP